MRRWVVVLPLLLAPLAARAGFTETLPMGMFMIEEAFVMSLVDTQWSNSAKAAALVDDVVRYEPGGGLQGILTPQPKASYYIMITKIQYGITSDLTAVVGIPVVIKTKVDPNFSWTPGDYQRGIGRSYSEADFWEWAESMGQPKPGTWTGNEGVMSDLVLAARYQWTQRIPEFKAAGVSSALTILGAVPTGEPPDPEEPVAAGTTLWDLHTQGDLCFHLGFEKTFEEELDGRFRIGLEVFYEHFFERKRKTPTGSKHPLLLTQSPYVGDHYKIRPGDFSGFAVELGVVPYKGPAEPNWFLSDPVLVAKLPPIISLSVGYTFIHLQQTEYESDFPQWDYDKEKLWKPGYKNRLVGELAIGLFRLGVPVQIFAQYASLTWIPGKNARAPDIFMCGLRIPAKFW